MDEMKIFGLIPYEKSNERDRIIKGLKVEFGKDVRVKILNHYIEYSTRKKEVELVI